MIETFMKFRQMVDDGTIERMFSKDGEISKENSRILENIYNYLNFIDYLGILEINRKVFRESIYDLGLDNVREYAERSEVSLHSCLDEIKKEIRLLILNDEIEEEEKERSLELYYKALELQSIEIGKLKEFKKKLKIDENDYVDYLKRDVSNSVSFEFFIGKINSVDFFKNDILNIVYKMIESIEKGEIYYEDYLTDEEINAYMKQAVFNLKNYCNEFNSNVQKVKDFKQYKINNL